MDNAHKFHTRFPIAVYYYNDITGDQQKATRYDITSVFSGLNGNSESNVIWTPV